MGARVGGGGVAGKDEEREWREGWEPLSHALENALLQALFSQSAVTKVRSANKGSFCGCTGGGGGVGGFAEGELGAS